MNAPLTIILFTWSYPYDSSGERPFLEREVEYLSSYFDRVIIVPQLPEGKKFTVPAKVEVEESYGWSFQKIMRTRIRKQLYASYFPLFLKDLLNMPLSLLQPSAVERLVYFVLKAEHIRRWVCDFICNKNIDVERTIFYTYWLNHIPMGIGMAKKKYPQIKLISRAHGYDLYKYRWNPPYFPCRFETLRSLDRLFLISRHGRDYITNHYPWFAPFCEVSRLGARNPGFITQCSKDGVFRIVSCAILNPEKRLDLLLNGIRYISEIRQDQIFEWHHIGDGQFFNQIRNMIQKEKTPNFKCYFYGFVPHDKVMPFYRDNPLDVFMNVSQYEGLPVSVMEAQSCSIPVIATAVGGTPEIVSNANGILLSANPTPREIALAICDMLDNSNQLLCKKKASHKMWQDKCDADVNFQDFAKRLKSLIDQS